MTKSSTTKALAKARSAAPAKPTEKAAAVPVAKKAAKADRTFHATAILAAQAAKETPKSAVLHTAKGFYTGSKRAGVKAGAEFIGRVVSVLAAKRALAAKTAS